MLEFTKDSITDAVVARLDGCASPRFKQVMTALVRHLHDFIRETEITEAEWQAGIQFLTATGQMCTDQRQEFILLSDTLGVSMLVDAVNHHWAEAATESTVLGPFYVEGAPELPSGAAIAGDIGPSEAVIVSGRVLNVAGEPIEKAVLDVWHSSPQGFYDVQVHDAALDRRGKLRTDENGRFEFRTTMPAAYPVPTDGPVGEMLRAMGRHAMRPAHIHYIVTAPGYEPLTTHVFVAGDQYLASDAVFAVKESLIVDFQRHDSEAEASARGTNAPFWTMEYDFVLMSGR
jgi:hydroxyquinol 1,2-dioxygenase